MSSTAATISQREYQQLGKIRETISGKGYKLTEQRIMVLDALRRNKEHLSAEDIAVQLYQEGRRVSRSTIYRTLAILEKLGLVNKLDVGDGQSRYEFAQTGKHHHLICIKCGKAIDISGKAIEAYAGNVAALVDVLSADFDFDVQSHRLEFWGICSECRRKG